MFIIFSKLYDQLLTNHDQSIKTSFQKYNVMMTGIPSSYYQILFESI
jgi:hypothetical protein